jgi:hypothetical protein
MPARQTFRKDPDANLDYGFDWSDWLETGEALNASVWDVPAGLVEGAKQLGTSATKVWLSGGTAGATYTVSNQVTTDAGRIDERSFSIVVEER